MSSPTARREEIELLREELADLDRQVADGDLDEATASRLAGRYRKELLDLESRGDDSVPIGDAPMPDASTDLVADSDDPDSEAPDAEDADSDRHRRRRVSGRTLLGIAVVGVAMVAITAFAVASLDRGDQAGAEGIVGDVLSGGGGVDLSQVTNEQMEEVVAANPDVIGMRLALARRYFEAGEFDKALDHYFEVLEREQHPEALANIGWMTYLSDRPDVAVGYLEAALQRQPDYLPAQWFIANVYVTLGRIDEAVPLLTGLVRNDDVPQAVVDGATALLRQIESGS